MMNKDSLTHHIIPFLRPVDRPPCRSAGACALAEIENQSRFGGWIWLDLPAAAIAAAFATASILLHFLGLSNAISLFLWVLFLPLNLKICEKNDRSRIENDLRAHFAAKIDTKKCRLGKIRELVNLNNSMIKTKIVIDLSSTKVAFFNLLFSRSLFVVVLSPRFSPTPVFARRFFGWA